MHRTRDLDLRRLGHLTVAWGVLFAVVHAYWAAGGDAGMQGDPIDGAGARAYVAVIAVLGLVGAAVGHGLADRRTGGFARRRLGLLARVGGAALLAGVAVGVIRWVADGGLGGDGAAGVAITAYFLLGGALFTALARHGRRAQG